MEYVFSETAGKYIFSSSRPKQVTNNEALINKVLETSQLMPDLCLLQKQHGKYPFP